MNDRSSTSQLVRFGPFEVDLESGQLRKGGVKVRLQEQPFRVLSVLIERPGEVVPGTNCARGCGPTIRSLSSSRA